MGERFLLIDQASWPADALPALRDALERGDDDAEGTPVGEYAGRRRRLPSLARTHTQHAIDPTGHGNAAAARALRALQGKFVVVNEPQVVPLPFAARPGLRRAVLRQADAARRAAAAGTPSQLSVALYEPEVPLVGEDTNQLPSSGGGPEVRFAGEIVYRLQVHVGPPAAPLPAPAADLPGLREHAPEFWFQLPLLVPDALALAQMSPPTVHRYREITGRLGNPTADRYWHVPAWERFREQGRILGCLVPSLVEHGYTPGVGAGPRPDELAARAEEQFLFGSAPTSVFPDLTPDFDRRGFVPPGYCLVRYYCFVRVVETSEE